MEINSYHLPFEVYLDTLLIIFSTSLSTRFFDLLMTVGFCVATFFSKEFCRQDNRKNYVH